MSHVLTFSKLTELLLCKKKNCLSLSIKDNRIEQFVIQVKRYHNNDRFTVNGFCCFCCFEKKIRKVLICFSSVFSCLSKIEKLEARR